MILEEIIRHKKIEVEKGKLEKSIQELVKTISYTAPSSRRFSESIKRNTPTLIAEIKKHSPSKGAIWEDVNPSDLAFRYEKSGASAISILTDEKYFHGSSQDFVEARNSVSLPCLRKEFIIDEYQIYESRVINADALLLIVRILSKQQLKDYIALTAELGMECLVEVHSENEIETALYSGAKIIGVNNRDLDTLKIDVENSVRLKKLIPNDCIAVSESGIDNPEVIMELYEIGYSSFLVGESILLSRDPERFIPWLLGKSYGKS
ncbi:MAG: indole-3-glycerol phosphate synthase TrpC [Candidatus Hydrogenedentes bacterium]|nr:indole-3-glycerol phosphate synthase TrpC [Candidatus Hydrogenedentota bacterium]